MKKVKLNLDKKAVQQFFLQHTEKIVLSAMVVCFGLIVYQALAREAFDQTPQKLNDAADSAGKHIEQTPWNKPPDPPVFSVDWRDVEVGLYLHKANWIPSRDEPGPPGWPIFFPVEGLRGVAGVGAFQLRPPGQPGPAATPARGNRQERVGQRWVVLTGLVPYQRQLDEYVDTFRRAQRRLPQRAVPDYIYYRVERAEVTGHTATSNLQWTRFNLKKEMAFANEWAVSRPMDVVDDRYLDRGKKLVFPLGPLVRSQENTHTGGGSKSSAWDGHPEVAYPDEIPLRVPVDRSAVHRPAAPAAADGPDLPDGLDIDLPDYPRKTVQAVVEPDRDKEPTVRLFRFFDFTAQPGKSYVYRVRLMLTNPHYGVPDRHLHEDVLADKKATSERGWQGKETPWSEPTEIVYVPRDDRLLAVSVTPPSPSRPAAEPTGKVLAVLWVKQSGETAYEEFDVDRGKVMNFPGRTFPPSTATSRPLRAAREPAPHGPREAARRNTGNSTLVDYLTEAIVLDLRASRLPGKEKEIGPGEILLWDMDGNLVVRNEVDDRPEYDKYTSLPVDDRGPDTEEFDEFEFDEFDFE